MLGCKETAQLVSQSYDRRLSWRERLGVRLHMVFCDACNHFRRQMEFLRRAARGFTHERGDIGKEDKLSAQARERITRDLKRRL
ncbi:MAG: anti-sigma factor family protein [Sulfuricaulis sp.]